MRLLQDEKQVKRCNIACVTLPNYTDILHHIAIFRPVNELVINVEKTLGKDIASRVDPAYVFLACFRWLNDSFNAGESIVKNDILEYAKQAIEQTSPTISEEVKATLAEMVFSVLAHSPCSRDYTYVFYDAREAKTRSGRFRYVSFKITGEETECLPVNDGLRLFRSLSAIPDSYYRPALERLIIDFILNNNPVRAEELLAELKGAVLTRIRHIEMGLNRIAHEGMQGALKADTAERVKNLYVESVAYKEELSVQIATWKEEIDKIGADAAWGSFRLALKRLGRSLERLDGSIVTMHSRALLGMRHALEPTVKSFYTDLERTLLPKLFGAPADQLGKNLDTLIGGLFPAKTPVLLDLSSLFELCVAHKREKPEKKRYVEPELVESVREENHFGDEQTDRVLSFISEQLEEKGHVLLDSLLDKAADFNDDLMRLLVYTAILPRDNCGFSSERAEGKFNMDIAAGSNLMLHKE